MRKEDIEILRDVQKNTEMAMKAIDTISDKVYDDDMAMQLARENIKYGEIRNKALKKIISQKAEPYKATAIQDMMLKAGIHMNTLLDTSTSHVAELMIRGSNMGLTQLWKSANAHSRAEGMAMEIAQELMDFEAQNIERMKKYL